MKRLSGLFIAIMIAAAPAYAQGGNPMSDHYKAQWANVRDLLVKMADKMPDADYRFKPTPEMQDFGQRVQLSVFECTLNAAQLERLRHRLLQEIDPELDNLRIYRLAGAREEVVEAHGSPPAPP